MGQPPRPHTLKLWVDLQRGFVLRNEFYSQGQLVKSAEITRFEYDLVLAESTFVLDAPPGSEPFEASSGPCIAARTPGAGQCERAAPEGFLFPAYVPEGFLAQYSRTRDSIEGSTEFAIYFEKPSTLPKSTHTIAIKQFRRASGFPRAELPGSQVVLRNGRTAYRAYVNHAQQLMWIEGDLAVTISTSLPDSELTQIAESMR
jgi:hypothetical protein